MTKFGWIRHEGDHLSLNGWAICLAPEYQVAAVEIYLNGRLAASVAADRPRPDVANHFGKPEFTRSGWHCRVPVPAGDFGDCRLLVISRSDVGTRALVFAGSVADALTERAARQPSNPSAKMVPEPDSTAPASH